jgi:hypothetical protein
MPDDYENTVIIYGMYEGVQTPVAVDEDGNLQAVLLGEYAGAPKHIALDENGKIAAVLYGVYAGAAVPVAVDSTGRLTVSSFDQANINPDTNEVQTWDATLTTLVNNLNRIRWSIVSITGEAWGTVSHSIASIWAKFHATTGHAHTGATADGPILDHGTLSGKSDDDHPQYILADGTRVFSGDQSMDSHKITNLAAPEDGNDAARLIDIGVSGYPVDSIFLATVSTDPSILLGVGTWIREFCALFELNRYPPEFTDTYVKTTTQYAAQYKGCFTCNPSLSLIGGWTNTQWSTPDSTPSNQRFHIDLGVAKAIIKIYYENSHTSGTLTNCGVQNFTLWGSNDASSFADLDYSHDTGWTQVTTGESHFDRHVAADTPDPKYIGVEGAAEYRYWAFKFADNWGHSSWMGVRRIVLIYTAYAWRRVS